LREAIAGAVAGGELSPGVRLPPERTLAAALGLNRSTVARAYADLAAAGIVEAVPSRGTVVRGSSPADTGVDDATRWIARLPAPFGQLPQSDVGVLRGVTQPPPADAVMLVAGVPPPELVPVKGLLEALERTAVSTGAAALGLDPVEGLVHLRDALEGRLAQSGVATSRDGVLITAGATQALSLVAGTLVRSGDLVAVESPTYVGIAQTFSAVGCRVVGIPTDRNGMRVDLLAEVARRRSVRLVVVQPAHQNPTGAILSESRRARLLSLAREYEFPIVEDDAYGEITFAGERPQPLKSRDRTGSVIHVNTFSKTLAPGLRTGYVVAPRAVIDRLALAKQFADLGTSSLSQMAVAGYLDSGEFERHLQRVLPVYHERRDHMLAALQPAQPWLRADRVPEGGFHLWVQLAPGYDCRQVALAAQQHGVGVLPGALFMTDDVAGPREATQHLRLSFAHAEPADVDRGLERLMATLDALRHRGARAQVPVVI
jgi:DNA-binding transcriptional MocR family regulator